MRRFSTDRLRRTHIDTERERIQQHEEELGGNCLTPDVLAAWISSKGEDFGSVYLVPYDRVAPVHQESTSSENLIVKSYRYTFADSDTAQATARFMTLRYLKGFSLFGFRLKKGELFCFSSYGMNEFHTTSEVKFVTLDEWLREFDLYEKLADVPFFKRFKKAKAFQTWKKVVKRQKFVNASLKILENSCVFGAADPKMRDAFCQVQSLVGKLTDMGITEILPRKTYNIKDLFSKQQTLVADFGVNFSNFRENVCQLVLDTCKSTFHENGLDYDDYAVELAWLSFADRSSVSSLGSNFRQPKKMTFMEQVNKRKVCEKLVMFVRLIDYMLRWVLHCVACNSLIAIHKALLSRAKSRPVPGEGKKKVDKGKREKEAEEQEIPVFTCLVSVHEKEITISPGYEAFEDGFKRLLSKLNESIRSIALLGQDKAFHPFTRPILYGKIVEVYKPVSSETEPFLLQGHEEVAEHILDEIKDFVREGFAVCRLEMEPYVDTAREFCELDNGSDAEKNLVDVETDVDSLKSKLSSLTDQQQLAKNIKDSQVVALFRADFRPLKRIVLPNISKTIIRMQDALPKLGREKMDNFDEDCKAIKELIDFELKTTEDYVNNMDIARKLQDRYDALEAKLEGIENVYLIMKNIPVPVSSEDNNSLKSLKSQLKAIKSKVFNKVRAQADILTRFEEALETEQVSLRETVTSLLQDVKSPTLLELDSTVDEVKPALAKIGVLLEQSRAKVLQYNRYEQTYGFPITEYLDLVAAEKILAALKTVWKSTEEWEAMYTKWACVEFSQLDVEDLKEGTGLIEYELDEAKEALGDNPMSDSLRDKVERTKQRIPVLKDLRSKALKERHWKSVSEIVGADLSATSGKKITIEMLDKYSVFEYGFDISRIVRTATLEEELDCLVTGLRRTWSERKPETVEVHGMPTIQDFNSLYDTIDSSISTLRELGMSRYSSEMKEDLLEWCGVVEKAEKFIEVLKDAQELWLFQEVPLSSMAVQDNHPWAFEHFSIVRSKLFSQMAKFRDSGSLLEAFTDDEGYLVMRDILLSLKETHRSLVAALWSLRSDSPRLFFLSDRDLLQMLCQCHNNLPALHQFLQKMFPWFSSLVLVENTDLTVSKKGYHPEIKGVMSKDGETVQFEEIMRARLGVDHWVKCIGQHVRSTMREMSRKFPHETIGRDEILESWKSAELPTQIQIVCIHSFWCRYFQKSEGNGRGMVSNFKKLLMKMEDYTTKEIRDCGNSRLKSNREVAKLFLLEYYRDLILVGEEDQSPADFHDRLLVRHHWLPTQRILCCRTKFCKDHGSSYGYEYNGQEVQFSPLLVTDRVAYNVLLYTSQRDVCIVKHDVRKSLFRNLANIHGRLLLMVRPDVNANFKESLVGGIMTNSWLFIESLDHLQLHMPHNLNFLVELTLKIDHARKFGDTFVELLDKEVDFGSSVNIFISKSNLHILLCPFLIPLELDSSLERYRQLSIIRPSTTHRIRIALLKRGITDNLTCIYLCSLVERVISAYQEEETEFGKQVEDFDNFCLEIKMLNAINQSISTSRLAMVQQFLSLGVAENLENNAKLLKKIVVDVDLVDLMSKSARMAREFRKFFTEQSSVTCSSAASSSQIMIENCIKLERSVSNFPITCVVANMNSTTSKRSLLAMEKYLHQQTGCVVVRICAMTQLYDDSFVAQVFESGKQFTGIIHIIGEVPVDKINSLRTISSEFPTLKVVFSTRDRSVLSRIEQDVHCLFLKRDERFDVLTALTVNLNPDLVKFVERTFDKYINEPLAATLKILQELQRDKSHLEEQVSVLCTVQSLCVPLSMFFNQLYESGVKKALNEDVEGNEGEAVAASSQVPVLPEEVILKSDFIPCILKATSVHLKTKEGVERYRELMAKELATEIPQEAGDGDLIPQSAEANKPLASLVDGNADFYVPNSETRNVASLVRFYLMNKTSVLLLGEKGCGKSLTFNKVTCDFPSGMEVKYLTMTASTNFNYEVSLLLQVRNPANCVVVLENFSLTSSTHCHFANSILHGRTVFDDRKNRFKQLPKFVVFVEASCPLQFKEIHDLPTMMTDQMVSIVLHKSERDEKEILDGITGAVSGDTEADEESRKLFPKIVDFLRKWHESMKTRFPTLVTDHLLHRVISGMLAPSPEEQTVTGSKFTQHSFNEIVEEYSCFDSFEKCSDKLLEFDEKSKIFGEDVDRNLLSLYQFSETSVGAGYNVELQSVNDIATAFVNNYHYLKGKAYNNRLVFSSDFTKCVTSLIRSFTRFGNVMLVGPKGCGKSSAISFCAQYLGMELVSCPGENFGRLKSTVAKIYEAANEGIAKLLFVPVKTLEDAAQVFDYLEKVFYYYDLPENVDIKRKMGQLFKTEEERFQALIDPKRLDGAGREMHFRIQDNLHFVITMRPDVFAEVYRPYSGLFLKSGTVRMTEWSEETLISIAEDRFLGLEKEIAMPVRNVSKVCASLHNQMISDTANVRKDEIATTQYLDMVKVLPQMYKPMKKKLLMTKTCLQTGIDQVMKANTFINKLTNDITEKEPEILRLKTEIEQLNKRLTQERINLDRASKAFRKKEVAARRKSEETQELAADAHRNLEHAMPSLEAAMQAIHNIDKNDIMEMRTMKSPSEAVQQVLEAVCILLGVKADWATAKVLLADPALPQKLLDIDKDNIPDHVSKRVRRYIDNPKFIPDEVSKYSRACCSMCMWVRAIDLYAKIFKSIEPKRVRLLQSESELAELMAALRAETDRVAHIEATIQTIQSSYQDRVKRKSGLEVAIKQTTERLSRAQMLSYSLEEESERWKQSLMEVDKNLKVLVGNSVIAAMLVAYGGCLRQDERRMAFEKWRQICDSFKILTSFVSAVEFTQTNGVTPLKNWLGKFEFYNQNYLSLRMSNKWPVLLDPHSLGLDTLRNQNEHMVCCDMHDDKIVDTLKQAITKGQEVLIVNFSASYPENLKDVFEKRMQERIHAFVGLMGIPIMRKDLRVTIDGEELVCNPKFKLIFHSQTMVGSLNGAKNFKNLKKFFNLLNFEYSSEALDQQLLRKVMHKVDEEFCREFEESKLSIRRLETAVVERKDGVLDILLKCEDDVLDDKGLVVALKEAKAKVFEILNDLNQERKNMSNNLEIEVPRYKEVAAKMKNFTKLLDLLKESDASCILPKTGFIDLVDRTPGCELLDSLLHQVIRRAIQVILPSLRTKNRYVLQLGCNLIMKTSTKIETYSQIETLLQRLFHATPKNFKTETKLAAENYFHPSNENDPVEEKEVRKNLEALEIRDGAFYGEVLKTEHSLINKLDDKSTVKPLLVFHDDSNVVNACDIVAELALQGRYPCPRYVSIDNARSLSSSSISCDLSPAPSNRMDVGELNVLMGVCKREKRWLIVDNFHSVCGTFNKLKIPQVNGDFRIFFLSSHAKMKRFQLYGTVDALSLTHSSSDEVYRHLFMELMDLTLRPFIGDQSSPKNFVARMKNMFQLLINVHLSSSQGRHEMLPYANLQSLWQKLKPKLCKRELDDPENYKTSVYNAVQMIYGAADVEKLDEFLRKFHLNAKTLS